MIPMIFKEELHMIERKLVSEDTYSASAENKKRMEELLSLESVQQALAFIKAEQENSIQEQIEIASVESPTFHEEKRADLLAEKYKELGLEDVLIHPEKNVVGCRKGSDGGLLLLEGHIDTVFPFGTFQSVRRENGVLYAPGIYDNARGVTNILTVLRALNHCSIKTRKNLLIAGTAREEADGHSGGIRDLLERYRNVEAAICVDGGHVNSICYLATHCKTIKCVFKGKGGHSTNEFGKMANPLSAAGRAIALINEIRVPEFPRTTFATSKIYSCESSGINAIPPECVLYVDFCSGDNSVFYELQDQIEHCLKEGCRLETERWKADTISLETEVVSEYPGGIQDVHMPLVQAHFLAAKALKEKIFFLDFGYMNSNIPISQGLPAICYGSGMTSLGRNYNVHSTKEFFPEEGAYIGAQGLLLTLLMAAGVEGSVSPCIDE